MSKHKGTIEMAPLQAHICAILMSPACFRRSFIVPVPPWLELPDPHGEFNSAEQWSALQHTISLRPSRTMGLQITEVGMLKVCFTPDGRCISGIHEGGFADGPNLSIWDLKSSKKIDTTEIENRIAQFHATESTATENHDLSSKSPNSKSEFYPAPLIWSNGLLVVHSDERASTMYIWLLEDILKTGRPLLTLDMETTPQLQALSIQKKLVEVFFAPDGRSIAISCLASQTIQIWNMDQPSKRLHLQLFATEGPKAGQFFEPQFSPDGKVLLVPFRGSEDTDQLLTKFCLFDTLTGAPICTIPIPFSKRGETAYGFQFSSSVFAIAPDCRNIILLSKKVAILWEQSSIGVYKLKFDFLELPVGSDSLSFQFGEGISYSPDGSLFSATWTQYSLDGMTVGVWETTTYRMVSQTASTEKNTVSGPLPCKSLQFSKDGGMIATTRIGSTSAFIWEVSLLLVQQIPPEIAKKKPAQPRPNKHVITLSPNGKVLALSHAQLGIVEFWNLAPGPGNPVSFERVWKYQISDLEAPECDESECSCWSFVPRPVFYNGGDGFLFPCYSTHQAKNLRLVFFNLLSGTVDYSSSNRFPGLNKIKTSPRDETIVTGSFDGMLRIWAADAHPSLLMAGNGFPTARTIDNCANYDIFTTSIRGGLVEFSPDGHHVVFAHRTHKSYLLCVMLTAPDSLGSKRLHHSAISNIYHRPICKTDNSRFGEFRSIGFSPDGELICCGGTRGIIEVWDFWKQTLKFTLDYRSFIYPEMIVMHPRPNIDLGFKTHSGVDQITVSPDGKLIAAAYGHLATSFNAVQRYSDGLPESIKHNSHGNTLKGLFDKRILIRVWDIATRKQLNAFVIEFFDARVSEFPMKYPDSWFSFTEDSKHIIANTVFMGGKIFPVTRTAPPTRQEGPRKEICREHGGRCRRIIGEIVTQQDTLEYQRRHGTGVSGYEPELGNWIYYGNRPIIYIPPQMGLVGIQCHDNTVVLSIGMVKNYKFTREGAWEQYSQGAPQIMVLSFDPSKLPFDLEKECQKPLVWDSKHRPSVWYCKSAEDGDWGKTIADLDAGLVKCFCYLSHEDPYEKFRDSDEFKKRMRGRVLTQYPDISKMDVFEVSQLGIDPDVDDERKLRLYTIETYHLTSEEMKMEEENCTKPGCTVPPNILAFREKVSIKGLVLPEITTFPLILAPFGERRGPDAQTCHCHCEHRRRDEADIQTVDYALKIVGNRMESSSQLEVQEEGLSRYVKDFDNFLTKGQDWRKPEVDGQPWANFSKRRICINSS